ncbi:glycosyltransferase [Rhodoplanes sp. SY1]|uniref:glycosyltransferase n=1 Tax=Rhodoplanes sp. SY1 TaxID=3166646 RepID=UPI0038B5DD81
MTPDAPRHGRVLFDFSTSLRWSGPPVGIIRAEHELARFGLDHVAGFGPVAYDHDARAFRTVSPAYARLFLEADARLDLLGLIDPSKRHTIDRVPPRARSAVLWLLQLRRKILQTLERRRLTTDDPAEAARLERLQQRVMSKRHRKLLFGPDGRRRPFVPVDLVWQKPVAFTPDDVLVCAGAGWAFGDIGVLAERKRQDGFRLVCQCYDIIPILFPQFYNARDAAFRDYMEAMFGLADLVVVNSEKVREDTIAHCRAKGIPLEEITVVPLGADFSRWSEPRGGTLPSGLEPGGYALYVSTIEPRKNHRMLHGVWRRLVADGVVAANRFKLLLVGREGWQVDDLMAELADDTTTGGSLVHCANLDDATMAALYRHAAFCCYPSFYEGFGLPILESFHFGKAVLASSGGSLPEVVRDFSPCLDPSDPEAWYQALRRWITDPQARRPYEERIAASFEYRSWTDVAAAFYGLVEAQRVEP